MTGELISKADETVNTRFCINGTCNLLTVSKTAQKGTLESVHFCVCDTPSISFISQRRSSGLPIRKYHGQFKKNGFQCPTNERKFYGLRSF